MNLEILTRADLDIHIGSDLYPVDDNNDINEAKIAEDLILTDKEIESHLIATGLDLVSIKADSEAILRLKPIALDIIIYRLSNRPAEDTDISFTRYKQALDSLSMILKGLLKISETNKESTSDIKTIKLIR
jgi:hypothetical protein